MTSLSVLLLSRQTTSRIFQGPTQHAEWRNVGSLIPQAWTCHLTNRIFRYVRSSRKTNNIFVTAPYAGLAYILFTLLLRNLFFHVDLITFPEQSQFERTALLGRIVVGLSFSLHEVGKRQQTPCNDGRSVNGGIGIV